MGPRYNEGWNDMVNALTLYSSPDGGDSLVAHAKKLQTLADHAAKAARGADQGYFNGHVACAAVYLETETLPKKKPWPAEIAPQDQNQ